MNLLLILFDLRGSNKMNVIEIMIMARTVFQGFSKVYPGIKFFQNHKVLDEIKPTIMDLFIVKIEEMIKVE